MKRRRGRGATRPQPRRPRPGIRRPRLAFLLALAGVALLATISLRLAPPRRAAPASPLPDSILALSPAEAFRQATIMAGSLESQREMLLLQRVLMDPDLDRGRWDLHYDYASALNDVAFQVGSRLGLGVPAQGRSVQRVALMVRALAQLDTAERIADSPHALAMIRSQRAEFLESWGFPLDARESFRAALASEPTLTRARRGEERIALPLRSASAVATSP